MLKLKDFDLPGDFNFFETYLEDYFRSATNNDFVGIYVHDRVCGSGKTSTIFDHINDNILGIDKDAKIMFVCPYLKECHRVAETTSKGDIGQSPVRDKTGKVKRTGNRFFSRDFNHPERNPSKFNHLKTLLEQGKDVVITHSLFSRLDNDCIGLLRKHRYHLILDEEPKVFELASEKYATRTPILKKPGHNYVTKMSQAEIDTFFAIGLLKNKPDGSVYWGGGKLNRYKDMMDDAEAGKLRVANCPEKTNVGNSQLVKVLMWRQNPDVFRSFRSVNLLTYLFMGGQIQAYFDTEKLPYFVSQDTFDYMLQKADTPAFHNLITIHSMRESDFTKVEKRVAFSASWYRQALREKAPVLSEVRLALSNFFKQNLSGDPIKVSKKEKLWSTFTFAKNSLKGQGYTKQFVPFNKLATNEYIQVRKLAYMVLVTPQPNITRYIKSFGGKLELKSYRRYYIVQWLFRSAIREGKAIHVAIASDIMGAELNNWINEYASLYTLYHEVLQDGSGGVQGKSLFDTSVTRPMKYSELVLKQPGVKHMAGFNTFVQQVMNAASSQNNTIPLGNVCLPK